MILDIEMEWADLRGAVLEQIVPKDTEVEALKAFISRTEGSLTHHLREASLGASVEVHGSASRGTWLSGDNDVDVFMVLDAGYERSVLPRVLEAVKGYLVSGWTEAYAEHPYLKAEVDVFQVDFVPCFRVDPREGLTSATDRTPLHSLFVRERLSTQDREEVRLLKKFMKGVGVYGAEVKVGGFSGYLCELLVIHYGSFEAVLEAAEGWRRGHALDILGGSSAEALHKRFPEPLIVVDPVDPSRNVASAVSETVFWELSAASRAFLGAPSERFFFPREEEVGRDELLEQIEAHGSELLFVVVEDGDAEVPDVLWGQLYKSERALEGALRKEGFEVLRSGAWSDESSRHALIFELESGVLPPTAMRRGPPVRMAEDSERFIEAHVGEESTVSGPWIRGDRWWVEVRRRERDARVFVEALLSDGGSSIGVSHNLVARVRDGGVVLLNGEVGDYLAPGLSQFLHRFLKGRPAWLE